MINAIQTVLFDLDGTLLDTAQDIAQALNTLRGQQHLPPLPLEKIRPIINRGVGPLLKLAFEIEDQDPRYARLSKDVLDHYHHHLAQFTQLFPQMEKVLDYLEQQQLPWGIVTNKPSRFALDLLKILKLDHRAAVVICGDSLPFRKPDPEPIRHACKLIQRDPKTCVYVGDAYTDVVASKAAGTLSLVALYGYIPETDQPDKWLADGYLHQPLDLIHWLEQHRS